MRFWEVIKKVPGHSISRPSHARSDEKDKKIKRILIGLALTFTILLQENTIDFMKLLGDSCVSWSVFTIPNNKINKIFLIFNVGRYNVSQGGAARRGK